jgi:hypothetical protein
MHLNPYLIVKEFSDSQAEGQRKNAATALAVLADDESLQELLRLALSDPVDDVKERAELEISTLPPEKLDKVLSWVNDRIRSQSNDQYRAYRLLGRLRAKSGSIPGPKVSFLRRLALARDRSPRREAALRSLWWSLLGSVGGSVVFAAIIAGLFEIGGSGGDTVGYALLAILVAIMLGISCPIFSNPAILQVDRIAGATIDLGMTFVSSLAFGLVVVALFQTGQGTTSGVQVCTILMFPAMALATRGCMLLVLGISPRRLVNWWCEIGCGTGAGIVAVSAIAGLLRPADDTDISTLWAIAVPVAAGLSSAFAAVDARAQARPLVPVPWRVLGFLPSVLLVVVIGIIGANSRQIAAPPMQTAPAIVDGGSAGETHSLNLTGVPVSVPFTLSKYEPVQISFKLVRMLTYKIENPAGQVLWASSTGFPRTSTLAAGDYKIVIEPPSTANTYPTKTLSLILDRLAPKPTSGPSNLGTMQVTFNVQTVLPAPSRPAPVSQGPEKRRVIPRR